MLGVEKMSDVPLLKKVIKEDTSPSFKYFLEEDVVDALRKFQDVLLEYKELFDNPYLQSQIDKRKKIQDWMFKVNGNYEGNFNKAIICYLIEIEFNNIFGVLDLQESSNGKTIVEGVNHDAKNTSSNPASCNKSHYCGHCNKLHNSYDEALKCCNTWIPKKTEVETK
jgi:hypothetical protein